MSASRCELGPFGQTVRGTRLGLQDNPWSNQSRFWPGRPLREAAAEACSGIEASRLCESDYAGRVAGCGLRRAGGFQVFLHRISPAHPPFMPANHNI
jgi:hypothetical protein